MRWRSAVVVVLLLAGVGACGDDPDPHGSDAAAVEVDVVASQGAEGVSEVVSTGATLVAQTWAWSRSALYFSDDGGASWTPSKVPEAGGKDLSVPWRLKVLGDRVVVFGGRNIDPQGPRRPFVWWSADGGRSFVAGDGVAAADDVGVVHELDALGDQLIALGTIGDRTVSWASPDDGATWTAAPVDGLGFESQYSSSLASTGAALFSSDRGHLVRSTDGRRWLRVDLPAGAQGVGQVQRVGDLLVLQSDPTYMSRDGGTTWTALGELSSKTSTTAPRPPVVIKAAVGQHLIGTYDERYGDGESVFDRLVWSDDGGATWQRSQLGSECVPGEDGPEVDISETVPVGDAFVAIWGCAAGNQLIASTDQGRTWTPLSTHLAHRKDLFSLVPRGTGAVAIASSQIEQQVDDVIRLSGGG